MSDYSQILDDVLHRKEFLVIGKRVARVDALEKVLGKAKFTADFFFKKN